jgi:hypothetical protein
VENDVTCVVFCVGVAGLPSALVMSSLHYSLPQRLRDCIEILSKTNVDDPMACRALLTTLLLMEDEDRITNTMAEGFNRTVISEISIATDTGGAPQIMNVLKRKENRDLQPHDDNVDYGVFTNSADLARIMVERLAVLSVAETDTIFRKFERAGEKAGKTRRRKTGRDADLDGFDFKGEKRSSKIDLSNTSLISESSVKSITSKLPLKQPKGDTRSRMPGKANRQSAVSALLPSRKDGRGRRASVDHTPRTNRTLGTTRRGSVQQETGADDWSFDNTNGNAFPAGPMTAQSTRSLQHDGDSLASNKIPTGSTGSRGARNRQKNFDPNNFDPFASSAMSSDATGSTASETTLSTHMDSNFGGDAFDVRSDMMSSGQRSSLSLGQDSSHSGGPRVQVNIALNEDLTCFYKLSKMSSCNVEGVVQVRGVIIVSVFR